MGSHYKGSKEDVQALDSYIKLIRAADSIIARIYRTAELEGLTVSQFGVLEALLHLGPLCQRELGEKILKSSGNITMVIDNLEKRHLVERKRDRGDRRFVTVHLTEDGNKLIRAIFPRHLARIKNEFEILSLSEQENLSTLCRTLGRSETARSA
ncbi:MAG: MarR family transcriptional regulator [SAR324 cluster bacterium]|nr:MarR family transcriptional regulator [SAR324 cluster bacterium]MCZ6531915.1 MarR family transcriptional regulator [SAR324 cluster bacterium]MCZ6557780.1 MarR family transcriptional regulator [SAR324 cluster bacterium]MCZ6627594.1 MarR family transcriptional regulator [SAR324 cluster bacterium]MCZ6645067.1 MarR family transcriptional regulator [SAR324 cluster bacterium]